MVSAVYLHVYGYYLLATHTLHSGAWDIPSTIILSHTRVIDDTSHVSVVHSPYACIYDRDISTIILQEESDLGQSASEITAQIGKS